MKMLLLPLEFSKFAFRCFISLNFLLRFVVPVFWYPTLFTVVCAVPISRVTPCPLRAPAFLFVGKIDVR